MQHIEGNFGRSHQEPATAEAQSGCKPATKASGRCSMQSLIQIITGRCRADISHSTHVLQMCWVCKAGFLLKRGKLSRQWIKRWHIVRKGVFRYCEGPVSCCHASV